MYYLTLHINTSTTWNTPIYNAMVKVTCRLELKMGARDEVGPLHAHVHGAPSIS